MHYALDIWFEKVIWRDFKGEAEFTELICVEVNNLSYIPEGMTGLVILSQSYAYLKHEGPIEELFNLIQNLYNTGITSYSL